MRRLWWRGQGTVAWEETPEPQLAAAHAAIVRPIAATTCDLDVMILRGETPFSAPIALGHECIAEIVELGESVAGLAVGQLVVVPWHLSCGACPRCSRRLPNTCERFPSGAMYGLGVGGDFGSFFSDLVYVPHAASALVPLPAGLDPVACASASDNLPFGYELTIPYLEAQPGAPVLVMGGVGSVGLYAVAYAVAGGAGEVVYVDNDADRLARAEAYGAQVVEASAPKRMGRTYAITVDASGTAAGLQCAIRSTEPEGQCSSVGTHWDDVLVPMREMYSKGLHFYTGRGRGLPNIPAALAFVQDGRVNPWGAITDVVSFDDAPRRLASPAMKTVFARKRLHGPNSD